MIYLRTMREALNLSQSDIGRHAKVESKQVYRWERGESEPSAAGMAAFVRAVGGSFEHVARLMLLDSDSVIDEEVARALARDQLREMGYTAPSPMIDDRMQHMLEITSRLRVDSRRFDLWLGYGQRLADELADSD